MTVLAGCGSTGDDVGSVPTLHWYVGPDRVDPAGLARTCTEQAAGRYRIEVETLPTELADRHDLLVRRMLARDDTIDLLSLDSSLTAEFAAAGFLVPVPTALGQAQQRGIAPAALAAATYDDRLVTVPWFMEPQVLWFRGNLAERAGLDVRKTITWDDLIAGAQRLGVTIQIQDPGGSGLADWVNALVVGSGGSIVAGTGRDAQIGLASAPGRAAASVVEFYQQSEVGPGPSADALATFASPAGGFLLASASAVVDPEVASVAPDMVAASYPATGDTSVAPLTGVGLAVPAHAPDPEASYSAIECLTAPDQLRTLMVDSQRTASRSTTWRDKEVKRGFPQLDVVAEAVKTGATTPSSPYWFQIVRALEATWRPVDDVTQDATPDDSQAAVRAAVEGTLR